VNFTESAKKGYLHITIIIAVFHLKIELRMSKIIAETVITPRKISINFAIKTNPDLKPRVLKK
jgi:hypothetical protein